MSLAFFIYTLVFLVVCVTAASVCLSAYLVSHRRSFAFAVGMFLCYLLDVSFIFQSEFLAQNLDYNPASYYAIGLPIPKLVVSAGFLQLLWMIVCDFLDVHDRRLIFGPIAVFAAASTVFLFVFNEGPAQQFSYYSMRQAFLIWIAGYCLYRWRHSDEEVERMQIEHFKKPFIVFCILIACIIAEDALVILMLEPGSISTDFPLYLSERNISENILLLLFAWLAFRGSARTLALRFEQPPQGEDEPVQQVIEDLLPAYCKSNGLSNREGEVLNLLLRGKSNQDIADDLTLALGTVKAHVHNILKKTAQPNREDLKRDFWKA